MTKIYTTPEISFPQYYADLTSQPHALIGGTTGSGKSVTLNGVLRSLMRFTPSEVGLVLIDPKGVELADWDRVPHSLGRFCDPEEIARIIAYCVDFMEQRFAWMKAANVKRHPGADIYIVIDEYVDIRLRCPKQTRQDITRIACKGRAAGIHLIVCTQRPTREIIDGSLRACLPCVLALRTNSGQESRNLIDVKGAEDLPLHGEALYMTPSAKGITRVEVPFYDDAEIERIVRFWERQK